MKFSLIFNVFVLLWSCSAMAHLECLEGTYSAEGGNPSIQVHAKQHEAGLEDLVSHQKLILHPLSKTERTEFWNRMKWADDSAKGAECATDKTHQHVLCELSYRHKGKEPAFNHADSLYVVGQQVQFLNHDTE